MCCIYSFIHMQIKIHLFLHGKHCDYEKKSSNRERLGIVDLVIYSVCSQM